MPFAIPRTSDEKVMLFPSSERFSLPLRPEEHAWAPRAQIKLITVKRFKCGPFYFFHFLTFRAFMPRSFYHVNIPEYSSSISAPIFLGFPRQKPRRTKMTAKFNWCILIERSFLDNWLRFQIFRYLRVLFMKWRLLNRSPRFINIMCNQFSYWTD